MIKRKWQRESNIGDYHLKDSELDFGFAHFEVQRDIKNITRGISWIYLPDRGHRQLKLYLWLTTKHSIAITTTKTKI